MLGGAPYSSLANENACYNGARSELLSAAGSAIICLSLSLYVNVTGVGLYYGIDCLTLFQLGSCNRICVHIMVNIRFLTLSGLSTDNILIYFHVQWRIRSICSVSIYTLNA